MKKGRIVLSLIAATIAIAGSLNVKANKKFGWWVLYKREWDICIVTIIGLPYYPGPATHVTLTGTFYTQRTYFEGCLGNYYNTVYTFVE